MKIVRYADIPPQPWANGAGETREAWSDAVEGSADFTRRISIASLLRPAPFSRLPGILRTFMPIDDMALQLMVDGRTVKLRRFEILAFAGDSTVSLTGIDRPGRVLNIMSKATEWTHDVGPKTGGDMCDAALLLKEGYVGEGLVSTGDLLLDPDPALLSSLTVATIGFRRAG